MFNFYLEDIASAYAAAVPPSSPYALASVERGWAELAADAEDRAATVRLFLDVKETDDPEPYTSANWMLTDIHRGRFVVSRANSEHPLWTVEKNVAFRIVHDVLGHYAASIALGWPQASISMAAGFDWRGENLACIQHVRLLRSEESRMALFTECIAQTAHAIFAGEFIEQKAVDLRPWPLGLSERYRRDAWCRMAQWCRGDV